MMIIKSARLRLFEIVDWIISERRASRFTGRVITSTSLSELLESESATLVIVGATTFVATMVALSLRQPACVLIFML